VQAGSLLSQLEVLQRKTFAIMAKAEAAGDLRAALLAVQEARETAALLSRVLDAREEEGSVTRRINRAVQEGEVLYDDVCRNGLLNILRDVEGRNQMLAATRQLLGALKGPAHALDSRRAPAPAELTEAVAPLSRRTPTSESNVRGSSWMSARDVLGEQEFSVRVNRVRMLGTMIAAATNRAMIGSKTKLPEKIVKAPANAGPRETRVSPKL
jgi:hypothetical protein